MPRSDTSRRKAWVASLKDSMTWVEPPSEEMLEPGPRVTSPVKEMLMPRSYLVPWGQVKLVKLTSTPPWHRSWPLPLMYLAAQRGCRQGCPRRGAGSGRTAGTCCTGAAEAVVAHLLQVAVELVGWRGGCMAGCAPAVHREVVVGVLYALPGALELGLHAHGVGHNDPGPLQADGGGAVVGQVAQDQALDGVVGQLCSTCTASAMAANEADCRMRAPQQVQVGLGPVLGTSPEAWLESRQDWTGQQQGAAYHTAGRQS